MRRNFQKLPPDRNYPLSGLRVSGAFSGIPRKTQGPRESPENDRRSFPDSRSVFRAPGRQVDLRGVPHGHCSGTPNLYNLSEKCWQYTSNFYRSTPPICNAAPCWLLSLEERETPQHTSNLYCNTPPISTAARLPFIPAIPPGTKPKT